ncbi:hypothetical protein Tco_0666548, partial [Tanacetum coccineum]
EEEESAEDDYELRRREKGNNELTVNDPTPSSSTPSLSSSKLSSTQRPLSLFKPKTGRFKRYKSFFDELQGRYGYLFGHLKTRFLARKKFNVLAQHLQEVMEESSPKMVDDRVKELTKTQVPTNESEPGPSTSGNQEQLDDFDFWTDTYATDNDELPAEKVSQELVEELLKIVDEAKLRKVVDEMLRQRCTSGDEHQYHIDQMQNFLKNDIVWESRKEILTSPFPPKPTPVVQSCQRDPKAPTLSLVNQDLLYLKKGNSGPETVVLSLHKFPAVIFPDDDIEERTSRWVDKCVKKFNPYARYNVEHWKNPHAKIFYVKKQKEPRKPKEKVYSNSKIIQVIKTYSELGHDHKFVTKIIARRANSSIVSITEPDYKILNKNDIEDMYLLCINGKKVNLTAPTITFPGIEKYKMFSIVTEPVYGIIYKNNKKEKRVMRHQEIHKFYDATLKRVLEGLKSYNNDVKLGNVTLSLSKEDVEYVQLFEKEIEERLKHRDQMKRWEMYVNGRPLGSRRERLE